MYVSGTPTEVNFLIQRSYLNDLNFVPMALVQVLTTLYIIKAYQPVCTSVRFCYPYRGFDNPRGDVGAVRLLCGRAVSPPPVSLLPPRPPQLHLLHVEESDDLLLHEAQVHLLHLELQPQQPVWITAIGWTIRVKLPGRLFYYPTAGRIG